MKRNYSVFVLVQLGLFMSACSSFSLDEGRRPEWIEHPGNGVSHSAGMHINGKAAQEELAILRARTELAKRSGVSIKSEQDSITTVNNDRSSSMSSQKTHEDTNQTGIRGVVKDKWRDAESDVLWVWVVPTDN